MNNAPTPTDYPVTITGFRYGQPVTLEYVYSTRIPASDVPYAVYVQACREGIRGAKVTLR